MADVAQGGPDAPSSEDLVGPELTIDPGPWLEASGALDGFESDLTDAAAPWTQIRNTTVSEYKRICHLVVEGPGGQQLGATGFLVAPRTLLTCGHVLFQKDPRKPGAGAKFSRVHIMPGENGGSFPYGQVTVDSSTFRIHPEYIARDAREAPDYDWAAIILPPDKPLGTKVGFFGHTGALGDQAADWHPVQMFGYPVEKPRGTMWRSTGKVKKVLPRAIIYDAQVGAGQSGGPCLSTGDDKLSSVMAMHVIRIEDGPMMGHGVALRFTREVDQLVTKWQREGGLT